MNSFLVPGRLAVISLLLFTACSCPDNSPPPPVFTLAFSADTLGSTGRGFRWAEIRSAYLVRYGAADFQPLLDTLRQPTAASATSSQPVFPVFYTKGYLTQFALPDYVRQNVSAHSFRLVVPAASRTYDITDVVLEQTTGSGRCAAPRVSRRQATINGQLRDGLTNPPELTK